MADVIVLIAVALARPLFVLSLAIAVTRWWLADTTR